MKLACDSGLRNQPSYCLFRTTASARRPSNWRETTGVLSLGTGVSTGLGFPGQPSPKKHGTTTPALLWVILWTNVVVKGEKQNLFGSQNYNDVVKRVFTKPWEGWFQTDYEAISVARCWEWWGHSEKWLWKGGLENLKEANLHFMIQCVFLDEFLMNPALLFIAERWTTVDG